MSAPAVSLKRGLSDRITNHGFIDPAYGRRLLQVLVLLYFLNEKRSLVALRYSSISTEEHTAFRGQIRRRNRQGWFFRPMILHHQASEITKCCKKNHPEMHITIVSASIQFYLDVSEMCAALHPTAIIRHVLELEQAQLSNSAVRPGGVLVAESVQLKPFERGHFLKNAFAVLGTVCQNNDSSVQWTSVSRDDLVLWLREQSRMTASPSLHEDVVVQSPHVRLAQFRVPTDCRMIPILRDRLLRGVRDYQVADGSRENHFCMALEEALNNAFYHGNLEICSELKEDGSSRFIELAAEREKLSPWRDRFVFITELVSPFGTWITIQDQGRGFNVQAAIDRCNDPESLLASGRGLLLMRAFSDELFFNQAGNEVTLVLYSEGAHRELPLSTHASENAEPRYVLN